MASVQAQVQELVRKIPELSKMCSMLDRPMLSFAVKLTPGENPQEAPKPKIVVKNSDTGEEVFQDPWEFQDRYSIVQDEVQKLKHAIAYGTEYHVPEVHDPLTLLFDNLFLLGNANYLLMEYSMLMETEDATQVITNAVAPFDKVGSMTMKMTPIKGPDDQTPLTEEEMMELEDPTDLIGKPWTYLLGVTAASELRVKSDETFIQYMFNGELFCTEVVTTPGKEIRFEYTAVHHIGEVTQEFLDYLDEGRLTFQVFVNPTVENLGSEYAKVSTNNPVVRKFLSAGSVAPGTSVPRAILEKAKYTAIENSIAETRARGVKLQTQIEVLHKECGITQKEIEMEDLSKLVKKLVEQHVQPQGKVISQAEFEIYVDDFTSVDTDKSGYIEATELPVLFKKQTGRDADDKELLVLLTQFDTNHDGRIEFGEYMNVMLGAGWKIGGEVMHSTQDPALIQQRMTPRVDWNDIPFAPDQVTAAFLTKAFLKAGVIPKGTLVETISPAEMIGSQLATKVAKFKLTYKGDKKFGPDEVIAKFPSEPLDKAGVLSFSRRLWFAELAGYRDIPTRTLDLHRVQCFFAQDSCLLLQAAPAKPPTADDNLSPTHAEVALAALAQLHSKYWNFAPSHNNEFLLDDAKATVPFFRYVVAPGLRDAAQLCPAQKDILEALAGLYEKKMAGIGSMFLYQQNDPLTVGCADWKYDNIWFSQKGDSIDGINLTVDFQPMWAHPLVDVAAFMVRSFESEERKSHEKKIIDTYYQTLMQFGVRAQEFGSEDCWQSYINRVAYHAAAAVALIGARLVKEKTSGSLKEDGIPFKHLQQWSQRLAAAVKDHGLLEKFAGVPEDVF